MKEIQKQNFLFVIILVIACIIEALLFLFIPKYINNSITYSIEKKGVKTYIPEIISTRSMNSFVSILQDDKIKNYYELIEKEDKNYVEKYDVLNTQDIYVLKKIKSEEKSQLNELLIKATSLYTMFNQSEELKNMNFKPDATVINYYMGLTEDNEIKKIYSSYENLDKNKKEEYAISFVLEEYGYLHFDFQNIRRQYLHKASISVLLLLTITITLTLIIKYVARIINKTIPNKKHYFIILKNAIPLPIILIGVLVNIIITNKMWLIDVFIGIVLISLIILFFKKKILSIIKNRKNCLKILSLIYPITILLISLIGIIIMLMVPSHAKIANVILITSYMLEIFMSLIIIVILKLIK